MTPLLIITIYYYSPVRLLKREVTVSGRSHFISLETINSSDTITLIEYQCVVIGWKKLVIC